jgi:hypothetical protein
VKLDLPRIGGATVVAAGLGVALLIVFLRHAQSTPDTGPTAAALDEGFSAWFGAGLGLALGSALCSLWVRRGPRPLSGVAAGVVAYGVGLAPILVVTRPSDMSVGEAVGIAAFLLVPAAIFVALGATVGWFVATIAGLGRGNA